MTEVWTYDISNLSDEDLQNTLQQCSSSEKKEIQKFRFLKDRLGRLIGRKLVTKKLGISSDKILISESGKPYLQTGPKFNISHSGKMVAVAFSKTEIGLDIEEHKMIGFEDLIQRFHPNEQAYFLKKLDEHAFFKIWTRKEAFLKALGTGITRGLNLDDCLQNEIQFNENRWSIKSLQAPKNYSMALCSNAPLEGVKQLLICKAELFV